MLIKEYRIPLPLTVDEYRIAQLYMIAKKSRDESSGEGSGVEIIVNEPYMDGPGGNGQYTKKIYHVGSHLPGWIKSLLPKSALTVEEEAWNAYPFTKTRYTCPFVEKFSLDIETYYFPDNGNQENVFKLSGSDLKSRVVDVIDIVKDQLYGGDYVQEEDPTLYVSTKTSRGPLDENWLEEYWNKVKGKTQPTLDNKSLMCAYKLCRVEFRYWGMQTKLEKFIHDIALRKTMLRAHRQAWAWQDEWHGLTMEDIREFERQTQVLLAKKMGQGVSGSEDEEEEEDAEKENDEISIENDKKENTILMVHQDTPVIEDQILNKDDCSEAYNKVCESKDNNVRISNANIDNVSGDFHSPLGSAQSFDAQVANWRMERLEIDSKSGSDDEFFDCIAIDRANLQKWSSLELLTDENEGVKKDSLKTSEDSIFSTEFHQRTTSVRVSKLLPNSTGNIANIQDSPALNYCSTTVLILVCHAGSVLDTTSEIGSKKSDFTTFRGHFESVIRQHYSSLSDHIALRLVPCPSICTEAIGILSSLNPYSFDAIPSSTDVHNIIDLPLGAIPLLTEISNNFQERIDQLISSANFVFKDFLNSDDGQSFNGQVVLISDSMGSVLAYEALCRNSEISKYDTNPKATSNNDIKIKKLDFEVNDFFMFGTPLAVMLAFRRIREPRYNITKPNCQQVYNMFHPTDPAASRIEPLLSARFSSLSPVNIPRYAKLPLGSGHPIHLLETIHSNSRLFNDIYSSKQKRLSEVSVHSYSSEHNENSLSALNILQNKWWGTKRIDYALYCPDGLTSFPTQALPHLFHASYWESVDVIAFVLRQISCFEEFQNTILQSNNVSTFPGQECEKWMKKRTSVKIKNVAPNHRANDVIVLEGQEQKLVAKFMYGPLDMFTLTGEKVDIYVMDTPPAGEWVFLSTELTDKTGKVTYTIPSNKSLGYGIYHVKMVVKGDHTSVDFYMAVVPMKTECVVFSIDGSFTASMSVSGKDPKVRAGAVDVCRHWQELGYLLIYVTGRPDLQQQRVVSWLSQHNFPHGLISFADGLSTDPLGHKTAYLNNLILNHGISIVAAYGSSKDISVYTNIGLQPSQMFIVGKVSKKLQANATILTEGYANHLSNLKSVGGSRPAKGNARMVIPRVYFNLSGQIVSKRKKTNEPEIN
ncbi:protein retinal degeneration B isoform X2 [Condylostylus longicornis]|uniref:protein retinal degeneration B isoform X2 n=1 Tax=Condylostylus longicornis TaxID=2530218 RepID=UPI00244E501F|nr:protein retinal degeneration B isoform X2 [Condylostylus longicornis]